MTYALDLPRWLRLYAGILAAILLVIALVVHVVGSLALAANVNPLLGLAVLALAWPFTGILAISIALLWLTSVSGFWKLGRLFLATARTPHPGN